MWSDVSVPFRGTIFLNMYRITCSIHFFVVSVPFRGTIFLNTEFIDKVNEFIKKFPSPFGELSSLT